MINNLYNKINNFFIGRRFQKEIQGYIHSLFYWINYFIIDFKGIFFPPVEIKDIRLGDILFSSKFIEQRINSIFMLPKRLIEYDDRIDSAKMSFNNLI